MAYGYCRFPQKRWMRRHASSRVAVAVAYGVHEYRAAADLLRERDNTRAALHESEQNRGRSVRLSARLALEQGLILCESGEIGPGLQAFIRDRPITYIPTYDR